MTQDRYRLAVFGSGKVGKTCIIRRYLNDTFSERYKETVEDIYSRDFSVQSVRLPLDIYDTNYSYQDMLKLAMSNANAFLLVFSINDVNSFRDVTLIYHDLCARRRDLDTVPLVIAGNKADVEDKKIYTETVNAWIYGLKATRKLPYFETSAKTKENIPELFKSLLHQSGFPYRMASSTSGASRLTSQSSLLTPVLHRRNLSVRSRSPTRFAEDPGAGRRSPEEKQEPPAGFAGGAVSRFTRHGSLMRRGTHRLSMKMKQADPETEGNSDCTVS